jgi:hypothetical protein
MSQRARELEERIVELWHMELKGKMTLAEALGMTPEQYATWARDRNPRPAVERRNPGHAWRVESWRPKGEPGAGVEFIHRDDDGVFDELVVDDWFHLENMHRNAWWMRVGEREFWVTVPDAGPVVVAEQEE